LVRAAPHSVYDHCEAVSGQARRSRPRCVRRETADVAEHPDTARGDALGFSGAVNTALVMC
jgi:hypothetical protein